jgi:two-component system sensor histidine kinase UhpB
MLANALDTARNENSRLYRQLITLQEEERREIANELHDEAGPCLFGIAANASSIKSIADQLPQARRGEISRRVREIQSIATRLRAMNRALIKKLRPGPLGRVKLVELITELTAGLQRRHPDTRIHTNVGKLSTSYGEQIDLTIYRCIQEAITNAIRHGCARNITIDLVETEKADGRRRSAESVQLTVTDDGKGMERATPKGFGLTTMIERVSALSGTCEIESAPDKGATIRVEIPVGMEERKERARVRELVGELS